MSEPLRLDAAVEVGIAAFSAGTEPPSDDEAWDRLTGAGVEPWLAERLLIFLPMAYVRWWLSDVAYQDTMLTPSGQVDLSAEPVFVAALDRASRAGRSEVERIALRGSEFDAINQLLDGGSKLSDLVLTETRLVDNLSPVQPGDGGVPSPLTLFEGLLREHGVPLDGETEVDARLSVHSASTGVIGRVEFAVSHPALAKPWLVESTTGFGATWRAAIGGAVHKFALGALHPIVDGLFPREAADQVTRQRYEHPSGVFEFVHGPQSSMVADQPVPEIWSLLDRLLETLRVETLSRKVHWLRLFAAYDNGRLHGHDVLLDSEPWPGGAAVVADTRPLPSDGMISVHVFGMLVPVE
ncbi:DUF6348 family protein [Nocardia brasiliensis]|uniref:DUF6348 family protein n=1 Tax=Nocardia brasiliensis TaxID=37326 RepID=UPI002455499D|nr:DUF6348 family protein [Nocardia brasiliensis]